MKISENSVKSIIMISISKPIKVVVKRVIAVLDMPKKVLAFIEYAGTIHDLMTASSVYSASATHLAILETDLFTLTADQTACKTKPPTKTTADRNTIWETVKNDLRTLRSDVQILANASPENAIEIIVNAGMKVKDEITHGKRKSSAKNGVATGSVDLVGEGAGPHEFQMSTDNKTWTPIPSSRTEKSIVLNLTPGTVYYFQNRRMLTKGVKTAWTESVSIRVN